MKTLLITIFALVSFSTTVMQDKTTIEATYDGLEGEVYYFIDNTETTYAFDAISDEAMKKFDLTSEDFIGKKFKITYTTEILTDEMENDIETLSIVDLEKVE